MTRISFLILALAMLTETRGELINGRVELSDFKIHRDFPSGTVASDGTSWLAYIEHDGRADRLRIARHTKDGLEQGPYLSEPGVIHQPALTADTRGGLWCFWGELDDRGVIRLRARRFHGGNLEPTTDLATSAASDSFAHAGTDPTGRVWVTWQSLRRGQADVYCRHLDPATRQWSEEIRVTQSDGGNWEPQIAFAGGDAWIAYDSSRTGEFNLQLARVTPRGIVTEHQLTDSPDYEARVSIVADAQRDRLWIAAERGRRRWGLDSRGHQPEDALNGQKRILLGRFDLKTSRFTEVPVAGQGRPLPMGASNVNLPVVALSPDGMPLLAYRVFTANRWQIALIRHNPEGKHWTTPKVIPDSSFGQDRRATFLPTAGNRLQLAWPSDKRTTKLCGTAAVYLGEVGLDELSVDKRAEASLRFLDAPEPYLNGTTPDRAHDDHHTWVIDGVPHTLLWGDLHRHTDFSNCRTGFDGCIVEHFRYAYDMAALDFMGTSDHTDIGKPYDPYEWWQTQRLVDVFYAPGKFNSLYAYEREQRFPWGHRNVVFPQRGGPIVYIKRKLYENSSWHALYPSKPGQLEIDPPELWSILRQYGRKVSVISHTGATSMGTDWDRYESIDNQVENIVEIFQGARVSYEGLGAPQPTVGLTKTEPYTPHKRGVKGFPMPPEPIEDFINKDHNRGVYQRALGNGLKLGVFASSDHVSTHTSFGGVYVREISRDGIIEGFNARRTVAATDKIFIEFSANGSPLGTLVQSTAKPTLHIAVHGTAPLKRVTIVRNETNHHVFEPAGKSLSTEWIDPAPAAGENRYYLRIEQSDGNMGWSSPVWVKSE